METFRYLPIIDHCGEWIDRPDLFLLARMAYADREGEGVVNHLYDIMTHADNSQKDLNSIEKALEFSQVRKRLRHRLFAGQVVLEAVRIATTIQEPASAAQAIKLCAHRQFQLQRKSSEDSLIRDVKRGFSDYRCTSHLQAALVLFGSSFSEIETSLENTRIFLSCARSLELFMDTNFSGEKVRWNPWRVPQIVAADYKLEFSALSEDEKRLLDLH